MEDQSKMADMRRRVIRCSNAYLKICAIKTLCLRLPGNLMSSVNRATSVRREISKMESVQDVSLKPHSAYILRKINGGTSLVLPAALTGEVNVPLNTE